MTSKDFHDMMLELERMKKLNVKALLIQRVLRGYKYRSGDGPPPAYYSHEIHIDPAHLL